MGKPGVMLSLASQFGANTLSTTLAIEQALANLAPALKAQGITVYPALHRPANFIERALGDLEHSLAIAAVLILVVLYLFLRDVRAALIAFTAIPLSLLAAVLVRDSDLHTESRWLTWMKARQVRAVLWVEKHIKLVGAVLLACCVAAVAAVPFLGGTFMPEFREGHFVMQVVSSIPGTSLQEMLGLGKRISAEVLQLPYVATIEQQIGRAELGEDTWGPHQSEFHVELKSDATVDKAQAQDDLRAILKKYPGVQSEVVTFLGDRISESLTGSTAQVAIKVFGEDLDTLESIGKQIVAARGKEPGLVDLQSKRQSGSPPLAHD